jgi:hypothetical protein
MNWVEPEIVLDRSQNTVMVVSSRDLLQRDHGTQKYGVDSFRFAISLRLVKSNDHEHALQLFVFRNPCLIVEMEPRGEKHSKPVGGLLEPFLRIGRSSCIFASPRWVWTRTPFGVVQFSLPTLLEPTV